MGFFSDMFYNTFDPKYGFLGRPLSGALRTSIDYARALPRQLAPVATPWLDPKNFEEDPETTRILDEYLGGGLKSKLIDEPVNQLTGTENVPAETLLRDALFPRLLPGDISETTKPSMDFPIGRPTTPEDIALQKGTRNLAGSMVEKGAGLALTPEMYALPSAPGIGLAFLPGIAENLGSELGAGVSQIESGKPEEAIGHFGGALVDALFGLGIGAHAARGVRGRQVIEPVEEAARAIAPREDLTKVRPTEEVDLEALMAPEKAKIAKEEDYNARVVNMTESFLRRVKDVAARTIGNENVKNISIVIDKNLAKNGAAFSRELNTLYLNPDKPISASDILHELAHTNAAHAPAELAPTDVTGVNEGRVPISERTTAVVPPEQTIHTWENIDENAKISPIEHEFQTSQEALFNHPDLFNVSQKYSNNMRLLQAERFRGLRELPELDSESKKLLGIPEPQALPIGSNDPVVKFVDSKREKYGDEWASKLDESEKNVYNSLLKGEGTFTPVEETKVPETVTEPVAAQPPKEAITPEGPKIKWRVTKSDGSTTIVEAATRGDAASIVKKANPGVKLSGISEAAEGAKEGEIREGIQEKQSTYVVQLSDGTSRTTRAYSENQARNAVEKGLAAINSDLKVENIRIREKGESTAPSVRRIKTASELIAEAQAETATPSEPVKEVSPPAAEPVTDVTQPIVEKERGLVSKEAELKNLTDTLREGMPLEVRTDPEFSKFMERLGFTKDDSSYSGFTKGGKKVLASEVWKIWKEHSKGEKVTEGEVDLTKPPTTIKELQAQLAANRGRKKPPTPKEPPKPVATETVTGAPKEPSKEVMEAVTELGEEERPRKYKVTLSDGTEHIVSATSPEDAKNFATGKLEEYKSTKTVDKVEEHLGSLERAAKYELDPWTVESQKLTESLKETKALKTGEVKEAGKLGKEEEKLRKAQVKEKFQKKTYLVRLTNGETTPVQARNEQAAREKVEAEIRRQKSKAKVYSVQEKKTPIERAVSGVPSDVKKLEKGALDDITDIPKTLKSAFDISWPGRQGFFLLNREVARKGMVEGTKSGVPYLGRAHHEQILNELANRKNALLYKDSGLNQVSWDPKDIAERSEQFASEIASGAPGLRHSERAFNDAGNLARANMFDLFADRWQAEGKTFETHPELYKGLANYLNVLTMRKPLPLKLRQAGWILNKLFFSPMAVYSRLELMDPLFYTRLPKELRGAALRDIGGTLGTVVGLLGLTKVAATQAGIDPKDLDISFDPAHTHFLRLKVKETYYDLPGITPMIRTLYRIVSGRKATPKGEYRLPGGLLSRFQENLPEAPFGSNAFNELSGFIENKTSPPYHALKGKLTEKGWYGRDYGFADVLSDLFLPMSPEQTIEAGMEYGPGAAARQIPNFFGIGTSAPPPEKGSTAGGKPKKKKKLNIGRMY